MLFSPPVWNSPRCERKPNRQQICWLEMKPASVVYMVWAERGEEINRQLMSYLYTFKQPWFIKAAAKDKLHRFQHVGHLYVAFEKQFLFIKEHIYIFMKLTFNNLATVIIKTISNQHPFLF